MAAIAGFSVINTIVKITRVPAVSFAFYRLWLGGAAMLLVSLGAGRRVSRSQLMASLPGGVLFGLNITLFFSALKLTSVADVLIIASLQPALTFLVAGRLFGERVSVHDVAWSLVSLGGVALVIVGSSGTPVWSLRGDLLAVGALLAWTIYFLVSKRVRQTVPALQYMTAVTLTAATVVTPLALLSGQSLAHARWQDWLWLALFLVGAQGGHVLLAWAHPQVDVSVSSLLTLAEPIISAVAALIVLGEPLPAVAVAGGLLVVSSVGAVIRRTTREAPSVE